MIDNTFIQTLFSYVKENIDIFIPELKGRKGDLQKSIMQKKISRYSWSSIIEYEIPANQSSSAHVILAKISHTNSINDSCPVSNANMPQRTKKEYNALHRINLFCTQNNYRILQSAKPLGYLQKPEVLFIERVNGVRLYDLYSFRTPLFRNSTQKLQKTVLRCGMALKLLHSIPTSDETPSRRLLFKEAIENIRCCWRCSGFQSFDITLTNKMTAFLNNRKYTTIYQIADLNEIVLLHGDCHSKNIIVLPEGAIVFIDPTLSRFGLTHEDIAQFIVDLRTTNMLKMERLSYHQSFREKLVELFLEGYSDTGIVRSDVVNIFVLKSLLTRWCELQNVLRSRHLLGFKNLVQNALVNRYFVRELNTLLEKMI